MGQICTIFNPIWGLRTKLPFYLAYIKRFDVVPQAHLLRGHRSAPDPIWSVHILRRAYRGNHSPTGAIVSLCHLRQPIWLVPPGFGENADLTLISRTSFNAPPPVNFYLKRYFDEGGFLYERWLSYLLSCAFVCHIEFLLKLDSTKFLNFRERFYLERCV